MIDPLAGADPAAITARTQLAAVVGDPVRHSLSPAIHNAAFAAAGRDWRCMAFEVRAGAAAAAVAAMRTLAIGGLAVTMPHKGEVAGAVDEVDPAAAALGAVNTVALRPDGSTYGANTDGRGFVRSVDEAGVTLAGARVVVLGAGGAARSVIDALGRAEVAEVVVANRNAEHAESAAALAPCARVGDPDELGEAIAAADVLVNATPVGMAFGDDVPDEAPVDPSFLRRGLVVVDLVYHPLETELLRAARRIGATTVDGLGMLVHQAALQHELWTGGQADVAAMRAAAEAELAARAR